MGKRLLNYFWAKAIFRETDGPVVDSYMMMFMMRYGQSAYRSRVSHLAKTGAVALAPA
jgi:hypothetical protein